MKYLKKFEIKNKLVFILGGEGHIGKEISNAMTSAGGKVVILEKKINKKLSLINNNIIRAKFDVSNLNNLDTNLNEIIKKYGTPDIFINASYPKTLDWHLNSFKKIKYKSFEKNLKIHLNSFSWTAKLIADTMSKKNIKGNIILLSSIYGVVGQDLNTYEGTQMAESMSYAIIKGGINNLTRQMASYYGQYDIRVNAICPGGVYDKNMNKTFIKNYNKKVPLKRLAKTSDIASGVLFLSSDASSYITGITLMVDGGWTAI